MRRSSIRGKYILQHLKEMLLFCGFLLVYCHHIVAISKKEIPPTCEAGKGLTGRVRGLLQGSAEEELPGLQTVPWRRIWFQSVRIHPAWSSASSCW